MVSTYPLATVLSFDSATKTWNRRNADLLGQKAWVEEVCVVFLEDGNIPDWYKDHCSQDDRRKILSPFGAPDFLASQTAASLNGFFGCKPCRKDNTHPASSDGELEGLATWLRILTKKVFRSDESLVDGSHDYRWYEMDFLIQWKAPNTCRMLCINSPPEVRTALTSLLVTQSPLSLELRDPFAMFCPVLDEIVKFCDANTWRVVKEVRRVEKNRSVKPDFERLHNLLRHINHISEVSSVAIETMERLLDRQEKNFKMLVHGEDSLSISYMDGANEYLAFQLQMMKSLKARALESSERLRGEINLAFNMLASTDNQIMKSITLLTMVFLPATFVSALFSTTFFSFEENGWKFSHMFWIYWVITIPITVIIVLSWWKWLGGSLQSVRAKWLRR